MLTDPVEINDWLEKNIPHRIRACLAITTRLGDRLGGLPEWPIKTDNERIARRCETDAIWEGRIAAMRWLIELVGLTRDRNGNPIAKPRNPNNSTDFFLDDLPGGTLIAQTSTEAPTLATVWKGSTQGSSHPTLNSGHPPVNEPELAAALDVIIKHLGATVYKALGKDVLTVALVPA